MVMPRMPRTCWRSRPALPLMALGMVCPSLPALPCLPFELGIMPMDVTSGQWADDLCLCASSGLMTYACVLARF